MFCQGPNWYLKILQKVCLVRDQVGYLKILQKIRFVRDQIGYLKILQKVCFVRDQVGYLKILQEVCHFRYQKWSGTKISVLLATWFGSMVGNRDVHIQTPAQVAVSPLNWYLLAT